MEIIGLAHVDSIVDDVDQYLQREYPGGPESLLLELPPSYPLYTPFICDNFFGELEKRYKRSGTRIVYGDRGRGIYENRLLELGDFVLGLLNDFTHHRRDRLIAKAALDEAPEVAVVGDRHAAYLKRRFPFEPYTRFEFSPRCDVLRFLIEKALAHFAPQPDRRIRIDHPVPELMRTYDSSAAALAVLAGAGLSSGEPAFALSAGATAGILEALKYAHRLWAKH